MTISALVMLAFAGALLAATGLFIGVSTELGQVKFCFGMYVLIDVLRRWPAKAET